MKLTDKEFARFKELQKKAKAGKLTDEEKKELEDLTAKKSDKKGEFKPGNDFSWWDRNPELTKDCCNLKCDYIAGNEIDVENFPIVLAGAARIEVQSVYGISTKRTDPLNVWARDLFLKMFHEYRIPSNYSAADLAIAIIAGLEVTKLIAKYERVYGVISRYSVLNVNMPDAEARALGVGPNTLKWLQTHLSDFRYDLNYLISKAQKIRIPKDITEILDAISMFGYEYKDHESIRSQILVFDTNTYGVFSDTTLKSGGSIEFKPFDNVNFFDITVDPSDPDANVCVALQEAINAIIGSDSICKIYADINVWYGQENMLQFMPIPEDYVVVPVYSESMLHKMHNLTTVLHGATRIYSPAYSLMDAEDKNRIGNGNFWIYQYDDIVVSACNFNYSNAASYSPHTQQGGRYGGFTVVGCANYELGKPLNSNIIDTYHEESTPETVMEGALFKTATTFMTIADGVVTYEVLTAGFYIVTGMKLVTVTGESETLFNVADPAHVPGNMAGTAAKLALLDWAPLTYESESGVCTALYGDVDNVIPVSHGRLAKIHRTAVLSGLKTDIIK